MLQKPAPLSRSRPSVTELPAEEKRTERLKSATLRVEDLTTASADTAYLYKVRAISPSVSPYSAPDLATTVIFTDPTLVAGTTVVKAAHFTQLRTAVDAVQALAGLSGGSYTDPNLTVRVTLVKAAHLTDLRSALDPARSALMLPAISYTRPSIVAGMTTISAADINDLRTGVQ